MHTYKFTASNDKKNSLLIGSITPTPKSSAGMIKINVN